MLQRDQGQHDGNCNDTLNENGKQVVHDNEADVGDKPATVRGQPQVTQNLMDIKCSTIGSQIVGKIAPYQEEL